MTPRLDGGLACLLLAASLTGGACRPRAGDGTEGAAKPTIQNAGSDTMVNLAQAWAEEYASVDPSVSVEVSGGGLKIMCCASAAIRGVIASS